MIPSIHVNLLCSVKVSRNEPLKNMLLKLKPRPKPPDCQRKAERITVCYTLNSFASCMIRFILQAENNVKSLGYFVDRNGSTGMAGIANITIASTDVIKNELFSC